MNTKELLNLQEAYLDIYASEEIPEDVQIAAEYFYGQGIDESGLDVLVEELGVDEFNEWVSDIYESYMLNEVEYRQGKLLSAKDQPLKTPGKGRYGSEPVKHTPSQPAKSSDSDRPSSSPGQLSIDFSAKKNPEPSQKPAASSQGKPKQKSTLDKLARGILALRAGGKEAEERVRKGEGRFSAALQGLKAARAAHAKPGTAHLEEFGYWVEDLLDEGYDLSDYTWEDMYDLYEAKAEKDLSPFEKEDIRNQRQFGSTKNRDNKTGFRREVTALQRGLKKPTPESDRRKSIVFEPYDDPIHVKSKLRKMRIKTAKNNIVPFREDFDLYDIILSHLLDEGYADNVDSALNIMSTMSEDWREQIIDEAQRILKVTSPSGRVKYRENKSLGRIRNAIGGLPADKRAVAQQRASDEYNTANQRSISRLNASDSGYRTVPTNHRARRERASGR